MAEASGTTPTMPNTIAYSFGDVVLVPFPFTDQTASKKRPAVVVSADAYHQRRPVYLPMGLSSTRRKWISPPSDCSAMRPGRTAAPFASLTLFPLRTTTREGPSRVIS